MRGGDAIATWIQYTGANTPYLSQATRLKADTGDFVWSSGIVTASTNLVNKGRLTVNVLPTTTSLVAVWGDGPTGNADIKGQVINFDGTLGLSCAPPPACLADVASDSSDVTRNSSGAVGPEDLEAFVNGFIAENPAIADVATDSSDTTYNPNTTVGPEDLEAFVNAFIAGC